MESKKITISIFEILTIVIAIFAYSYIISDTNDYFNSGDIKEESKFIKKSREVLLNWLSKGLVSAQEGLWTCVENLNGTICQEYHSDTCDENCVDPCLPGPREDFEICELGTCLDPEQGTCSANTPHAACENSGGEWFEQPPGQCNLGCCIIEDGTQTQYTTEITCNVISQGTGFETQWENVASELECLLLAGQQDEGACVFETDFENNCQFTTQAACLEIGGEFHKDLLCTNPDLETICEITEDTTCIEGKDEVYFADSCGNIANIYDWTKKNNVNYWSVKVAKENSCELESGNNPLAKQKTCGNCAYLLGSICGTPGLNDEEPKIGEFVCKDLSCVDEWGDDRKNGESWCAFDGRIGVDGAAGSNNERSVDVPGSGSYRRVCLDGEVRTETCASFRNEICVESRDEQVGFSAAACRINQWQVCLDANTDGNKLDKCEESTDCFLKNVNIDQYFEFDVCAPKYPPGFDLRASQGGEVAEVMCGLASIPCTYVEVKDWKGKWKCEANCNCKSLEYTKTMNNLCMSLGDCGASVTIEGKYTDSGYSVSRAPRLDSGYVSGLKKYAEVKKGQKAESLSGKELAALFGMTEEQWEASNYGIDILGKISGGLGIALIYASSSGIVLPLLTESVLTIIAGTGAETTSVLLTPFGAAAAGALVGAAIVSLVLEYTGIGKGLPPILVYVLIAIGAYSGASYGLFLLIGEGLPFAGSLALFLLVYLIFCFIVGCGDTREIEVKFTCSPWQPPTGGANCGECGNDPARPCTKYKCQSLGQTCELINEGSEEEVCVDINPNDASPPIINVNEEAIGEGFEYIDPKESIGTKIESTETDNGCIKEYSPVQFGVSLNEPGQCKVEEIHTSNYNDMDTFFGGSNLYKLDHETIMVMPSLVSLGVPGFGPDLRGTYDLFVRCQDSSGNANVAEYTINFCVSPADDVTPPIITEFIPPSPGYAGLNISEKFVQFYTNEPADCKWSLEDKDYELMENLTICNNEIDDVTPNGWLCSVNLPVGEEDETNYYFRCADQPWLLHDDDEENDDDRNINTESFIYTIIKTTEELIISFISPNNETITAGGVPVSVDLEIHTEGGVDGTAQCRFSFDAEGGIFINFFETGGSVHTQTFSTLFEGDYNIALQCTDVAENVATGTSVFTIEVDDVGPIITLVYNLNGILNVITNEPSQCVFTHESCGFNFDDGELMSGSDLTHTTSFEQGLTYYIKCRDDLGNVGMCLSVTGGY